MASASGRSAIVVLGAAVRAGGEPSPALRRRIDCAIECARRDPHALLLLTGGVGLHPPAEAEVMARSAEDAGLPRERMRLEMRATTTAESARYCAEVLRYEGVERVLLVTDAFHQRRSRMLFRRVGFAAGSASPARPGAASPGTRVRRTLREWAGLVWYGLTFFG